MGEADFEIFAFKNFQPNNSISTSKLCIVTLLQLCDPVLIIMASPSGHLTSQTYKFDQSECLYIINGKVIEFLMEKPVSGQFQSLS